MAKKKVESKEVKKTVPPKSELLRKEAGELVGEAPAEEVEEE